jgi:hypothetical protein
VYEGDVVVGDDYIAEGGEAFFYSLGIVSFLLFLSSWLSDVYLYLHFVG